MAKKTGGNLLPLFDEGINGPNALFKARQRIFEGMGLSRMMVSRQE
jgi:hypothetical protein